MNYIDLIKKFEGYSSKAYLDTGGVWTIGYGHTKGVKEGMVCTEEQGGIWLNEDVEESLVAVNALVNVPLNTNQHAALVSFVFNLGQTQFSKSTLLKYVNVQNWNAAALEFPKWCYDNGKIIPGLVIRRHKEQMVFLGFERYI